MHPRLTRFMAWLTGVVGFYLVFLALEMDGHVTTPAQVVATFGLLFVVVGSIIIGRELQTQRGDT